MIIIDYADILAAEQHMQSREERHKLNATWGGLRSLAQEKKCLVVTGTQTLRSTFKKDISEADIAEDIRKLAHVTHMFALNQNKEDKKRGVMRVGALVLRDDDFHIDNEVIALQCLAIGKPCLDSKWKYKVKNL